MQIFALSVASGSNNSGKRRPKLSGLAARAKGKKIMSETNDLFNGLPEETLEQLSRLPSLRAAYERSTGQTFPFAQNPPALEKHFPPALAESLNGSEPNQESTKPTSASGTKSRRKREWATLKRYSSKGNFYYRFVWGCGHSVKGWHHLPGGNWRSPIVQQRRSQVRQWLKQKQPAEWIAKQIDRWGV